MLRFAPLHTANSQPILATPQHPITYHPVSRSSRRKEAQASVIVSVAKRRWNPIPVYLPAATLFVFQNFAARQVPFKWNLSPSNTRHSRTESTIILALRQTSTQCQHAAGKPSMCANHRLPGRRPQLPRRVPLYRPRGTPCSVFETS